MPLRLSDALGASAANWPAHSPFRCLTLSFFFLFFFTHLKHNGHFVFITAVQLNLCKSCPLIQLIDFAVISHSAAPPFHPFRRVFSASQRTLDGSRMVIARLRQVFRLSAAPDNMRLVHKGEKGSHSGLPNSFSRRPKNGAPPRGICRKEKKRKSISWLGEFRWELGKTVKQPARNRVECMKFNPPIRWGTNEAQRS